MEESTASSLDLTGMIAQHDAESLRRLRNYSPVSACNRREGMHTENQSWLGLGDRKDRSYIDCSMENKSSLFNGGSDTALSHCRRRSLVHLEAERAINKCQRRTNKRVVKYEEVEADWIVRVQLTGLVRETL